MVGTQRLGQRWAGYTADQGDRSSGRARRAPSRPIVVGFTWGGWVTGGTARSMAEDGGGGRARRARGGHLRGPLPGRERRAGQLAALKELQGWNRGSFIEKGGWATMPDKAKPTSTAARLCADQLVAL